MKLGEKIVKLRKEKGLSQRRGEQIGPLAGVSKWENIGFPETEKLLQLSNVFEVSVRFPVEGRKDGTGSTSRATMSAENFQRISLPNEKKDSLGLGLCFSSGHWPVCPG